MIASSSSASSILDVMDPVLARRTASWHTFSSSRRAASAIISFSAAESGRALSAKPSMAGVLPSAETSVSSAFTRCQAGLSTSAFRLE